MNTFKLQTLDFPSNCKINKHDFSIYNPDVQFSEQNNLYYLNEDLLQVEFEDLNLVVDLGWYGEISSNKGEFKIYVIKDKNWESPLKIESSKSQIEISSKLQKILETINS